MSKEKPKEKVEVGFETESVLGGRKRGALSTNEMNFIKQNCFELSVDELAVALNRNVEPVQNYIDKENLHAHSMTDAEIILQDLRNKFFYRDLEKQFDKRELMIFDQQWMGYFEQFNRDVTHTEEAQILEMIRIEILIARCMKDRQEIEEQISNIQKLVEEIQGQDDPELLDQLVSLTQQQAQLHAGKSTYIGEYEKLLNKKDKYLSGLKATRADRKKYTEDAKTNFGVWLRKLAEEGERERQGFELELQRVAANKAEIELAKLHTYVDGNVDQPILNSKTVLDEEEYKEEEYKDEN